MFYIDVTNRNPGLPPADILFLTHGHVDHLDTTAISNWKATNCIIVASKWAYSNLTSSLKAISTVLVSGDKTNLLGIRIEAIPMYNLTASNHPKSAGGSGFILTLGGERIYISGDTDNTPELRALQDINVAFIAMRGPPANMSIADAVSAVKIFQPKIVYPYHYGNNDPNSFKQLLENNMGIEVRVRKWY